MTPCDDKPADIRQLCGCYFDWAKRWWWISLFLKFIAFALGILSIWLPRGVVLIAAIIAFLLFTAEASGLRWSALRSKAEALHRKLDFQNSFGWAISEIELADADAELSKRARKRLVKATRTDSYFASTASAGWKRAMENLRESSWWSKHLARSMTKYCVALTVGLVALSIAMLIFSYSVVSSTEPLTSVSRVAISILLLIVSLGIIPLAINYNNFATACGKAEGRATDLLRSGSADNESQAIKTFNEYHLARATAPLLPTVLWKYKEARLNETWKQYVSRP